MALSAHVGNCCQKTAFFVIFHNIILSHIQREFIISEGTMVPPDLPEMFLDLLVPVKGLKCKKLPFECTLCGEEFATYNSLTIHNKSHIQPACLMCGKVMASASKLTAHAAQCNKEEEQVVITSKYGRSRPVKGYLVNLK